MLIIHFRCAHVLGCFLFALVLTHGVCFADATGIVEDSNGHRLAGVRIVNLSAKDSETNTLGDGSFELDVKPGSPMLIDHPAYGPVFMIFDEPRQPLRVILHTRSSLHWAVPACTTQATRTKDALKTLVLHYPRSLVSRITRDADYELVVLSSGSGSAEMRFWRQVVSSGMPSSSWFRRVDQVTSTRPLSISGTEGYDVRGKTRNGGLSRWVGCFYTFIEYSDVRASAAKLFDSIIDRLCYK